ncbi:MAG: helix-turn-helix domain-containing protein [Pyrinomonadaceae bacterium]
MRERSEDIEPIAQHLLKQLTYHGPTPELTAAALAALRAYHWPGNVRQLRNCLERAVLLSNDGKITVEDLPPEVVRQNNNGGGSSPARIWPAAFPATDHNHQGATGAGSPATAAAPPPSGAVPMPLREAERQQILAALEQTNWHRGKTAEMLASPSTFIAACATTTSPYAVDK